MNDATGETAFKLGAPTVPSAIDGYPDFGHILLEKIPNARDLGGMPASDGRTIKSGRLIRSGELHKATAEDISTLMVDFHVERVVDLRTDEERERTQDPKEFMEGVVFYDFPVLNTTALGITHGQSVLKDLKAMRTLASEPHKVVREVYPQALLGDAGKLAYRSFLDVLLEAESGATLWHCSEGKDRAGLAAVIVEKILGVSEEDIVKDYLATNIFARTRNESLIDAIAGKLHVLKGLDADVDSLFYAYRDYYAYAMEKVDEAYGSFDRYLEEALDFGPEKQEALRAMYLV